MPFVVVVVVDSMGMSSSKEDSVEVEDGIRSTPVRSFSGAGDFFRRDLDKLRDLRC